MSEKMKTIITVIGVELVACATILAVLLVTEIMKGTAFAGRIVMTAVNILITAMGAAYLLTGAKKNPGGKLMKAYLLATLLSEFVLFITLGINQFKLPAACYVVCISGLSILTVASDLGEIKSKIIALAVMAAEAVNLFSRMLAAPDLSVSGLGQIARFIIMLSLVVLVWAKYKDKAARGSK